MNALSKSVLIMFFFDFVILFFTTFLTGKIFNFPVNIEILITSVVIIVGLIVLFLKGNYRIREFNLTFWNFYRLLEGVVLIHIPVFLILFFLVPKIILIKFLAFNILLIYLFLCFYRFCFHYYLFYIKRTKNILILGTDERAKIIADEIQQKYALKMNVAGFMQIGEEEFISDTKLPIYSTSDDIKEILRSLKIDIVVIAKPTELIIKIPRKIKIYKMPEFYEMVTGKFYVDEKTITELFHQFNRHNSLVYNFCKRIFDVVSSLIILTVTFPILFYIAIRVKLTDGANPIYTQNRIGKGGKSFKCYKLRTMYKNDYVPKNVKKGGYATSQDTDDRVIPFCKFIRKARLDEIPQMINILKGEISIVGPRAEWHDLVKIYSKEIPFYLSRQWVKTGWTGWAQINQGHCINNDDISEKLQYDLYYLKHRNILWEICILIKAIFLALGGRHG